MVKEDLIDGTEFVKFVSDSTTYAEKTYGFNFKKGAKREIKTIGNYLKKFDCDFYIKKISWNAFKIFDIESEVIMDCELADDKYISDNFKNTFYEEHVRLYKVKDVSELINYLSHQCNNVKICDKLKNFSIKDWLIEQNLVPHEILHRRILQIIAYCKYKNITDINEDRNLKNYLTDYLQLILRQTIRNPDSFNYIIGLRISRYLTQDQFINFNIQLKILIGLLKRGEKFTYDRFKKLQEEYEKFEKNLINYVNDKIV